MYKLVNLAKLVDIWKWYCNVVFSIYCKPSHGTPYLGSFLLFLFFLEDCSDMHLATSLSLTILAHCIHAYESVRFKG